MIPLALIASDAITTAVGLHVGAEEANPAVAWLPGWAIITLGILASVVIVSYRWPRWARWIVYVWLVFKGITVAWNLAVLAGM